MEANIHAIHKYVYSGIIIRARENISVCNHMRLYLRLWCIPGSVWMGVGLGLCPALMNRQTSVRNGYPPHQEIIISVELNLSKKGHFCLIYA